MKSQELIEKRIDMLNSKIELYKEQLQEAINRKKNGVSSLDEAKEVQDDIDFLYRQLPILQQKKEMLEWVLK